MAVRVGIDVAAFTARSSLRPHGWTSARTFESYSSVAGAPRLCSFGTVCARSYTWDPPAQPLFFKFKGCHHFCRSHVVMRVAAAVRNTGVVSNSHGWVPGLAEQFWFKVAPRSTKLGHRTTSMRRSWTFWRFSSWPVQCRGKISCRTMWPVCCSSWPRNPQGLPFGCGLGSHAELAIGSSEVAWALEGWPTNARSTFTHGGQDHVGAARSDRVWDGVHPQTMPHLLLTLLLPLPLLLPQDLRRMQLHQDVLSLLCRFWFRLVWQRTSCPKVGMPWRRLAMWKAGTLRMPLRSLPSNEPGVSSILRVTKILPSHSRALKTQSKQGALLSPFNGLRRGRRGTLHRQTCLVTQPKSLSPVPVQHETSLLWSANPNQAVVREWPCHGAPLSLNMSPGEWMLWPWCSLKQASLALPWELRQLR